MSAIIEIQTIEGGRIEWVGIMRSSDDKSAIEWGDALLAGFHNRGLGNLKPALRITDWRGVVIGAWQAEGWTGADDNVVHGTQSEETP